VFVANSELFIKDYVSYFTSTTLVLKKKSRGKMNQESYVMKRVSCVGPACMRSRDRIVDGQDIFFFHATAMLLFYISKELLF
jgi:hypothetical protein